MYVLVVLFHWFLFFQAEDGIRDLVRSRGLGDVYKRQVHEGLEEAHLPRQLPGARADGRQVRREGRRSHHLSLIHI